MDHTLRLTVQKFRKDSYIIIEGRQNADRFFIIKNGNVQLMKEVKSVEEEGKILSTGDFFGVVSTMSAHNYIETARALSDVELISISRDQYQAMVRSNTNVAMRIIEAFSKRMRTLDEELARRSLKSRTEDDKEHLYRVAEYYYKQKSLGHAHYSYTQYVHLFPDGKFVTDAHQKIEETVPHASTVTSNPDSDSFVRKYPSDTMIFAESMPGEELFIIQEGNIKITKIIEDKEVLLAVLKPGDIFGEMALIENKPRSASAITYDDCTLLAVNRANFERMIGTQPQICERITTLFAERIWLIYKQLANTQIRSILGRLYDALLIQLEKSRVPIATRVKHRFDFGTQELMNMIGLSEQEEGNEAIRELLRDSAVRVDQNRILITDTEEISKQTEYFHKQSRKGHLGRN